MVWRHNAGVVAIFLSVMLMGCSSPSTSISSDSPQPSGQSLPITAQAEIEGEVIQIEVAQTRDQQAMGFMHRPSIPDDRGMLFPFDPPRPVQFWMRNVLVPLDMVFLRDGEVEAIASNVPPCTTVQCPVYGPDTAIDQVLELRGGRAEELGLEKGDRLPIVFLDPVSPPANPN
jgi:uncharacterized protein